MQLDHSSDFNMIFQTDILKGMDLTQQTEIVPGITRFLVYFDSYILL